MFHMTNLYFTAAGRRRTFWPLYLTSGTKSTEKPCSLLHRKYSIANGSPALNLDYRSYSMLSVLSTPVLLDYWNKGLPGQYHQPEDKAPASCSPLAQLGIMNRNASLIMDTNGSLQGIPLFWHSQTSFLHLIWLSPPLWALPFYRAMSHIFLTWATLKGVQKAIQNYLRKTASGFQIPCSFFTFMYVPNSMQYTVAAIPK